MRKFLKDQAPAIASQLHVTIQASGLRPAPVTKAAGDDPDRAAEIAAVLDALTLGDWASLAPKAQQLLEQVFRDGSLEALVQIDVEPADEITEQLNDAAVAFARDRGAELVGMTYDADGNLVANPDAEWAITDSTRTMLRGDVATAITDGMSTSALADLLSENYAFSAARAERIARTEIASADIQGNLAAYRASGVVSGKEVVLSDDHDEDDECDDAADMGVVPLDDDFGGLGDAPFHPECECDELPVLATDDD